MGIIKKNTWEKTQLEKVKQAGAEYSLCVRTENIHLGLDVIDAHKHLHISNHCLISLIDGAVMVRENKESLQIVAELKIYDAQGRFRVNVDGH